MKAQQWFKNAHPTQSIRVLGIDLGTTNSVVAEINWSPEQGQDTLPECRTLSIDQPTAEKMVSGVLVPSILAVLPTGKHWIGEGAKQIRNRPQQRPPIVECNLFFDTKNEMGLRKTYFRAPSAYNHASKIAGHILHFLKSCAENGGTIPYAEIVVTVPASFQLHQRRDTLLATESAGIVIEDQKLLDEPIAALIDYLFTHPDLEVLSSEAPVRTVVFDFGGGTCDVAIVEIKQDAQTGQLDITPLSISRYHRLGWGDIDNAIVHEHLLPLLLKENHIAPNDLTWGEKKRGLEPQLLGTAEALKVGICNEIKRLQSTERYPFIDKSEVIVRQPAITCYLNGRPLLLSRPTLSAQEWESLFAPFLDGDRLYAQESEFRLTQSLFAPLQDALQRAHLEPEEIDACLMVGGSSLIPQVADSITGYLSNARICMFDDPIAMQTAVARGAAWHAFYLMVTGEPLVRPILHEGIALVTGDGTLYPLIPAKTPIPFPSDGTTCKNSNLAMPDTAVDRIKFQIVSEASHQTLFNGIWEFPEEIPAGTGITVEYRLTASQEFQYRAYLTDQPDIVFERSIENPLCNVVNPNQSRLQIEALEEDLRQRAGGTAEDRNRFMEVARLYAEIGQPEKALDFLRRALRLIGKPDADIMNQQGLYYGDIKDYVRQEQAFLEADKVAPKWAGPLFNLALAYRTQKRHEEALGAITRAIEKSPFSAPYYVLRGLCLQALGQDEEAFIEFDTAVRIFGTPSTLPDWELGWLLTCAEAIPEPTLRHEVIQVRKKRAKKSSPLTENLLAPVVRPQPLEDEDYFIW